MALSEELKKKLYAKYKKLADFIVSNNITKNDIYDLMTEDVSFQKYRDIVGNTSGYFEWRANPTIPNVKCSTGGDISIGGKIVKPVEYGGELKVIIPKGKTKSTKVSAASLVLSTFVQRPTDGVYIPYYRNQNPHDLRISNLYWYKVVE